MDDEAPKQAAVIPFRRGQRVELCLIRRRDSGKWGIPKGFIDRGRSPEQAALNEALEEAGLTGRIAGRSIGVYDYEKRGTRYGVSVFLMDVLEERTNWQEMRIRERRWFPFDQAAAMLELHPVRGLWDRVRALIAP